MQERQKEAPTTESRGKECVIVSENNNNNNKALATSTKIRLTTTITKIKYVYKRPKNSQEGKAALLTIPSRFGGKGNRSKHSSVKLRGTEHGGKIRDRELG